MKKNVNAGGSTKKRKFSPPQPNQTLITNFFGSSTNPHIPDFEANDEDDIVRHRRNKRVIVEDEEEVLEEVSSMAEDVIVRQPRKNKYANTTFYNLLASFYENAPNKLVSVPKAISKQANELVCLEIPNVTKAQAINIVKKCAMECRGGINILNGEKTCMNASVRKIDDARNNARNNPINNAKKQLKVAAENHLELMEMFKNGEITEKPLNKVEIEEIVDGLFLAQDKLNDENIAISGQRYLEKLGVPRCHKVFITKEFHT